MSDDFTIRWIQRFEGFRATPYLCTGGFKTIGYGHLMEDALPYPIPLSEDDATHLLRTDLDRMKRALSRLVPHALLSHRETALLSLIYNIGPFAFMRSTLRQKVLHQDHGAAVHEFGKWVWAGGRKVKGLIRRRYHEACLYQGDINV